jgi:hypothetical protein
MTIVTNTYTSDTTVNIPATASNVTITVRSANGGAGGAVPPTSLYGGGTGSTIAGGAAGSGREGTFVYKTNYVARTLTIRIGQAGQTGSTYLQNYYENGFTFPANCPGGSSNIGAGACGGASNHQIFQSGVTIIYQQSEGGAGAGATGVLESGSAVIVAGGGGGGSGGQYILSSGGYSSSGVAGGNAGNWEAGAGAVGFSSASFSNSPSFSPSTAGGGGGGGSLAGTSGGSPTFKTASKPGQGGGSKYNSNLVNLTSSSIHNSTQASVTISYVPVPPPEITSFYASPNPQTSGLDGVPNSTTQFSWSSTNTSSASINQSVGSVTTSGSKTIDTGLQSVAGSNSPATKSYILTVVGLDGSTVSSAPLTVSVYNDNTPNNFSLPNQNNVNPNTSVTVSTSISGIDMVTSVNGGPGVQVSTNGSSFSSNTTITNNQTLYARVTSLGFNQDPSGLTNSREFYVDVGPLRRYFTVTTRAPDVNETFNLPNESDRVPYPDIDTIDEPSEQYIVSNTLSVDDIELINPSGVEIRTNNGNAQIRKKITGTSTWGSWQDVRSI